MSITSTGTIWPITSQEVSPSSGAVFLLALAMETAGETSGPAMREATRQLNPGTAGERFVFPGEWAKAAQMIRDGTKFQYAGIPPSSHAKAETVVTRSRTAAGHVPAPGACRPVPAKRSIRDALRPRGPAENLSR